MVVTEFALGGDVADYNEKAQMSMRKLFAKEAGVHVSAVTLTLTAGSVIATVEIQVASQADADAKSSALASSVMKDPASLQKALETQFSEDGVSATVQVEQIKSKPK